MRYGDDAARQTMDGAGNTEANGQKAERDRYGGQAIHQFAPAKSRIVRTLFPANIVSTWHTSFVTGCSRGHRHARGSDDAAIERVALREHVEHGSRLRAVARFHRNGLVKARVERIARGR